MLRIANHRVEIDHRIEVALLTNPFTAVPNLLAPFRYVGTPTEGVIVAPTTLMPRE